MYNSERGQGVGRWLHSIGGDGLYTTLFKSHDKAVNQRIKYPIDLHTVPDHINYIGKKEGKTEREEKKKIKEKEKECRLWVVWPTHAFPRVSRLEEVL